MGNVALPALLFKSMLTLKFAALNWNFLLTVFGAKSALFALTCLLSALLFYDRKWGEFLTILLSFDFHSMTKKEINDAPDNFGYVDLSQ